MLGCGGSEKRCGGRSGVFENVGKDVGTCIGCGERCGEVCGGMRKFRGKCGKRWGKERVGVWGYEEVGELC